MYTIYINKSTVVAAEDYRSVSQFGQEMRLAGIQGVKVARWHGKTAPKYSCLAVARTKLNDWVANEYMPEVTAEDHAISAARFELLNH